MTASFDDILGNLYEATSDPDFWITALGAIADLLHAQYATILLRTSAVADDGLAISVDESRRQVEPIRMALPRSPFNTISLDEIVTEQDLMGGTAWRALPYFATWCAPYHVLHVLAVNLSTPAGSTYGFRVTRAEGTPAFSPADRETVRRLIPHLRRSLRLQLAARRRRAVDALYSEAIARLALGVIVLDESGAVVETNAPAREILAAHDGLFVTGSRLSMRLTQEARRLQQLIHSACTPAAVNNHRTADAMLATRPSGNGSWQMIVRGLPRDEWTKGSGQPRVVVFVRDTTHATTPSIRIARQLFRLTPAETALATQLANGRSLAEAAAELHIQHNTARAHLRSIFGKTGARRQAELVRLLLNSVIDLDTPHT